MTINTGTDTAVRKHIDVAAPPEHAFAVFTSGIDSWWPRTHHVQSGTLKCIGLEPRVGGRMWEENDAGDVCSWGRVLTWEPPRVFAFAWLIGTDWAPPAPDAVGSRVTVTFTPTEGGTRVELVHDQLEAHGPSWPQMKDAVAGDGGWMAGLRRFAEVAGNA